MLPADLPALLTPEPGAATLKTRRWGGSRLTTLRNAPPAIERPIGESWEFSTLPGSESRCNGRSLLEVLGRPLPFLAKLIDTALPLSIQVHPDDDAVLGRLGKEEAWVVLDAEPAARVLVGLRDETSGDAFARAVHAATTTPRGGDQLQSLLQAIPVRRGTVILVPAGTVHSIGGGILLAEIQQPTDCTYRLHDHGSDRELHIAQGLAAVRAAARPGVWQPGDHPAQMCGKHMALDVLGPGQHRGTASTDHLLVAYGRTCSVHARGNLHLIAPNDLRLVTRGNDYLVEIPAEGGMVIGSLRASIENGAAR